MATNEHKISLPRVRAGQKVRILSIDPGARRPGFACLECSWGDSDEWPVIKPLLLMGDPVIPATVQNVRKYGRTKCIDALDSFFLAHGEALFGFSPHYAIVETQKGVNNRLIDTLSMVMYVFCRHAKQLFPEACSEEMKVTMCPATWKTQGLGVPPGSQYYDARKRATVAKTAELLTANGFARTAAAVARNEAVRDISDAFMQAVQFFMHTFPKYPKAKKPRKPRAKTAKSKAKRVAKPKVKRKRGGSGGSGGSAKPPTQKKRRRLRTDEGVIDLVESSSDGEAEAEAAQVVPLEDGMQIQLGLLQQVERVAQAIQ